MDIRLLVLRTADMELTVAFYRRLGLHFEQHQHGNGPMHYAATIGKAVLELYPLAKNQSEADKYCRLGLELDNFDSVVKQLKENSVTFVSEPAPTDFGYMAVVADPDGRRVELYKR